MLHNTVIQGSRNLNSSATTNKRKDIEFFYVTCTEQSNKPPTKKNLNKNKYKK
jgi:hypothetical protein